jgi:hypothetical protein
VFVLVVVVFGLGFVANALFLGGAGVVHPVGARFPGRSPEIPALVLVSGPRVGRRRATGPSVSAARS